MSKRISCPHPVFSYKLWHWTAYNESLFTLSKDELLIFSLLVDEASK